MTHAERKRHLALDEATRAGASALVATAPANVRWLLCGRGRPVDDTSPHASYTVVLTRDRAFALFADIETSRVEAEERLDELGYEPLSYPRYDGPAETLGRLLRNGSVTDAQLEQALAPHRRELDGPARTRRTRCVPHSGTFAQTGPSSRPLRCSPQRRGAEASCRPSCSSAVSSASLSTATRSRPTRGSVGTRSWRSRFSAKGCTCR